MEAAEDEVPKLEHEAGKAEMAEVVLRWGVREVERRLREGSIDESTDSILLEAEDVESLRRMLREKPCDYKVTESRDLFCSASFADDPGRIVTIGLRTFARTSEHHCRECSLPDSDLLCSNLSHAQVEELRPLGGRRPQHAVCATNQAEIEQPSLCYPSGHECWRRMVMPQTEDKPPAYAAPALTQALDLLDSIWRLRFGKKHALVKLPSATSMANLERDCSSREEFQTRLIALADVIGAMNISDTLLGQNKDKEEGSLNRLEAALLEALPEGEDRQSAMKAISLLRAANALRRAAAHGGSGARTERVRAEEALKIAHYPDVSWKEVWDQLRARMVEALTTIASVLRKGI